MKNPVNFLFLFLFVPMLTIASEHNVDQELALRIAAKQLALLVDYGDDYHKLGAEIRYVKASRDTMTYFVVGFSGRPGFVIVSATRLMPPVLGISESSEFDTNAMPPALKFFLRVKEDQTLRNLRQGNMKEVAERFQEEWNFMESIVLEDTGKPGSKDLEYDSIPPLLHTKWGQWWPYNAHTPLNLNFPPAGCGPVAMAQVMRYHEYPDDYDWSQMGQSNADYNEELADLISDCGEAADTRYSHMGSATWPWDIDNAMKYVFEFPQARYDDIYARRWSYTIKKSIEDGFPVIVHGYEEYNIFDWHIFVADGYRGPSNGWSKLFHINWGWEGTDDGWYLLDECNPPGDVGPYNYNQGIIHQITPPAEIIMVNPQRGSAFPSYTSVPIAWQSVFRAADMDSAMIIVYQYVEKDENALQGYLNYDTIYTTNQPGNNFINYQFKKPAVALTDTGTAWFQVILYGSYGDNAKYRFYSEQIPFGVYHGEFMQFTSPVAGTTWQANMHHTVSWNYNENTNPEFLVKYKKVSGPANAPSSGQIVFRTQENSVDWLIPTTLEGTYYLEGTNIGPAPFTSRSGNFTIAPLPVINITYPFGNVQVQPGELLPIRWTSDAGENVRIKLQRWDDWDEADTLIIVASTANDGVFDWQIPESLAPGTLYSLTIEGVVNPQIMDGVFYFTIRKKITVTNPVSGNEWEMTKSYYVEWTDNFPEDVAIKLYKGSLRICTFALNASSDGSYLISVPNTLTPALNYRMRIHKDDDETIEDYSDYFSIVEHRSIDVTSPALNASWQRGQTYTINWTSNVPNGFKIELLNCTTNPPLVTLIHSFNYSGFSWTVPTNLTAHSLYKMRITSVQYPDVVGQSEYFSVISEPEIVVTTPNLMTSWPTATHQTITWTDNLSGNVNIYLYKRSAVPSFITTIASNIPSTGSHNWFISQTLSPGTDYYIIIRSVEFPAIQDASTYFDLTQGNYVLVTSPVAGNQWEAGSTHEIRWDDNLSGNVLIILRKPSLMIEDTISKFTPSDGSYFWTIPASSIPATNYNIFIRSVSYPDVFDYSESFEIFNSLGSFITVTSPTADSVWKIGTQRTITWDDNISEAVSVKLYKENSLAAILTAYNTGSSLTCMIPTSLTAGTDYRVRVTSTTNHLIYDYSPYFEIIPADFIEYTGPAAFRMNDTIPITWNDNINEHVKIELLLADTLYSIITPSTESIGSYTWGVPGNLPVQEWYKIRITSLGNPALSDISNSSHIYFPFHINVTNPLAGDVMIKDSSYAIQCEHNFINGERSNIYLYKGGDSLTRIKQNGFLGYYLWPINSLYDDLPQGNDYTLKVECYEHPEIYDFSEIFSIVDCDSISFSVGNDTTLYRNSEIDLIASEGYDLYSWTLMQCTNRINHVMGGVFNRPDTMQVVCMAQYSGGCVKRDTLILTIADPPCLANADFSTTYFVGEETCNTYTFLNAGDSTFGYHYQYDFGDVTIIDTTSTLITHTFPGPGTFIVTCTAYDPVYILCQDVYVDTIVIEEAPVIDFSYTISVDTGRIVPSVSGTGIYRLDWWIDSIPAVNLMVDSLTSDTLLFVFPENGTYQVCAEVYDTLHPGCYYTYCEDIPVTGIPPCRNTTCYFASKPLYGYGSGTRNKFRISSGVNEKLPCYQVSWNMGDGTPDFADILDFDYEFDPGMYLVTMTLTDCGACSFSHTDTIMAYPLLDPGLSADTAGCDSLTLAAATGFAWYIWNDSTHNATLPVYSSGSYWVMVQDGFGYYRNDTSRVSIASTIDASMSDIPVLCSDGSTYILTEGTPPGGVYQGDHVSGSSFNISDAGPGFYLVCYYFPNQGCSDTACSIIEVEPVFQGNRVLQNHYYTGSNYFTGDTIFAGSAVTDTLPPGPCVFIWGSNTYLKAQHSIRLMPGTTIMQNCYLNANISPLSCLGKRNVSDIIPNGTGLENTSPQNIFIGPNPAHDHSVLFIRDGVFDAYSMSILNSQGIPVMEKKSLSGKQVLLDLSEFRPGIYFILVSNGSDTRSMKLIRE